MTFHVQRDPSREVIDVVTKVKIAILVYNHGLHTPQVKLMEMQVSCGFQGDS